MTATLLDCSLRFDRCGDLRYSATFEVGAEVVRVRVCLDQDLRRSFALAEQLVLRDLTWRRLLAAAPPGVGFGNVAGAIEDFARELVERATPALAQPGDAP